MSHRTRAVWAAAIAIGLTAPAAAFRQGQAAGEGGAGSTWTLPRPDGQSDLQGNWTTQTFTPLERPEYLSDKAFYTEEAAALHAQLTAEGVDPSVRSAIEIEDAEGRDRTALTAGLLVAAMGLPFAGAGEPQTTTRRPDPQVEFVQTVGCVERRTREESTWWLTRAAEPTETRAGVFNEVQVDEARETALGAGEFRLIGFADFLTPEGLLNFGDRALFTDPDQINASGELRPGRTVLVKGLLIEADGESRINLTSVVGLADACD